MSESHSTIDFLSPVQDLMVQVEEEMRIQADGNHQDLKLAIGHILSSGGKRIRPAIALLMGRMLGAESNELIKLAAAVEMLHTATLVHDDLIDGASLRRGIATLNSQWSPAATVLTGDFIFARAAKFAAETNSVELMGLFAETLAVIVNGELVQMFSSKRNFNRENYDQRIYAKTASLFELATTASALLSKCDDRIKEKARTFGVFVGTAFQIIDDVLDFTGEQATVGKPVASDLRQGLITLPVIYYHEEYPDDPDIHTVIEEKYSSDALIDRLVTSIRMSGAIQRSLDEANRYVDRGLEHLTEMPESREREALHDLACFIVRRHV